jgi:small conductance mechanosensitive channel
MQEQLFPNLERYQSIMSQHGLDLARALVFLVIGLIAIKYLGRWVRAALGRTPMSPAMCATVGNIISTLLLLIVIVAAAVETGFRTDMLIRTLVIAALAVIAVILVLRPYIPTLPFKVGNTIKTGDMLGKVEATTLLNTRMKTFDGKTVFIPNAKILNDYLTNYQFTPTRRVKVDVFIDYQENVMKVKRVLEELMTEDARVVAKPAPMVYVLNLRPGYIEIGGRCWVNNKDYWTTRCELIEKAKFRLEQAGVRFANPKLDVFHHNEPADTPDFQDGEWESDQWTEELAVETGPGKGGDA